MGEALLTTLPGALLRTAIPVVAAILIAVLARGRARTWGIWGFVVMALGTLVSGMVYSLLPILMEKAELSAAVLGTGLGVVFTVVNMVGVVLLVIAIIVGGRRPVNASATPMAPGQAPPPQRQPWNSGP